MHQHLYTHMHVNIASVKLGNEWKCISMCCGLVSGGGKTSYTIQQNSHWEVYCGTVGEGRDWPLEFGEVGAGDKEKWEEPGIYEGI